MLVAQQRGWDYTTPECEDLDDDPAGLNAGEPTQTRIWIYDPDTGEWDYFAWQLEPVPPTEPVTVSPTCSSFAPPSHKTKYSCELSSPLIHGK